MRSSPPPDTHAHFLRGLQQQLDDALRPLVENADSIALLDFPDFSNVGDSAIWLGALASLRRVGAPSPCHTCDARSYDRDTLARRLRTGVILLNGGGNFGDLWPRHQLFRERVVADFPDNPIVVMPQSMHFVDPQAAERTRAVFRAHSRLTLLLRDRESLDEATHLFGGIAQLVPDTAFGLTALSRLRAPTHDILWLKRGDQEDRWSASDVSRLGNATADWAGDESTRLVRTHDTLVRATKRPITARAARRALMWVHPRLAQERLDRGVALLSSARVIVTDRLHGHILCLLLAIPHVVLDNSYGKLTRFIGAWSSSSALVRVASTPEEAYDVSRALLSDVV